MVYAGFRDAHRDIQDPPEAQSARASPDPHDEEYLEARPDQEEMEDAINKFLVQLEKPERNGFKDLASVLSQLPKPAQGSVSSISVADAIEAGFLPALDKDQANMFTLSELRLYRHALTQIENKFRPVDGAALRHPTSADALAYLYFHCALGFDTQILAHTLDSLVRVSRRVKAIHHVKIANMRVHTPAEKAGLTRNDFVVTHLATPGQVSL